MLFFGWLGKEPRKDKDAASPSTARLCWKGSEAPELDSVTPLWGLALCKVSVGRSLGSGAPKPELSPCKLNIQLFNLQRRRRRMDPFPKKKGWQDTAAWFYSFFSLFDTTLPNTKQLQPQTITDLQSMPQIPACPALAPHQPHR